MTSNAACLRPLWRVAAIVLATTAALATPDFVEHIPGNGVYGEPAGVTMRTPLYPSAGGAVDLWIRVGYSFYYTDVAVYFTTDGSEPQGSRGVPVGTTAVLTSGGGQVVFVRNEPHSPNIDWWRATVPASVQVHPRTVRYKIGIWHSGGGPEVFANNYGCADGVCDDPNAPAVVFEYVVALPWPGKGSPHPDHQVGYPPVYFWKEEAVTGNHYMNVQVDQNGTVYDIYYPSAGCVQGMGTRNEGYVDGLDTFPPGLPPGFRGQMNVNQAMAGLRVDGVTYWLSNENGNAYTNVWQSYVPDTNVVFTTASLTTAGHNIRVDQYDFCPIGIGFPLDQGGQPNRAIYLKRFRLTNQTSNTKTIQFYFYADFALNGGDGYDIMFVDPSRGAMIACDRTWRLAAAAGEYNPTSFNDYEKNVSIYLAAALKLVAPGGDIPATASWRQSGSTDNDQGWIGLQVDLVAGVTREVDLAIVGGFDTFANATGTYAWQIAPVLDWFLTTDVSLLQVATENYWQTWLSGGVAVDTPDDRVDAAFRRGLLATALHVDGAGGGVVAGMHNGAYPFVWPRDAVWAAVTLDRTGHTAEAAGVYRFLRDIAYRAYDTWGKGFWYQKYTTDGYVVWNAPQVDETAVVPWGMYYHYLVTGDIAFLSDNYSMVYEAARASSEDSSIDYRLYYDDPNQLMFSNNLWEDQWDEFVYSNASVERGLRDAASIATVLGHSVDAALFTARAAAIHAGIDWRLAADRENTDISFLGLSYPFAVYSPTDARIAHLVDRINGVAGDAGGQVHPLMNYSGPWQGLLNRYWGDTYWNGGPWTLSTLWYGCYYAQRQNHNSGRADIDNHLYRLNLILDRLGPVGLGAEQIAPPNSLLYPDFLHQAAWPNTWESMSFLVDAIMLFLDFTPDGPGQTLRIAPKLPSAWSTMTFDNLRVGGHRVGVTCSELPHAVVHTFVNHTGAALAYDTYLRVPAACTALAVTQDGVPISFNYDTSTRRVHVTGMLNVGVDSVTVVRVDLCVPGDLNCDCRIDAADFAVFANCLTGPDHAATASCEGADLDADGDVDLADAAQFAWRFTGP